MSDDCPKRRFQEVRPGEGDTYRLAERATDEFDDDYEITTLDLESSARLRRKGAFRRLNLSLEEIGFAVLVGHGVDPALYDEVHDQVLDLFESTPLEQKMRFEGRRHGSVSQGYFPIEHTTEIHPDLVEGWVWCRRAFDVPQERDATFQAEDYWPNADYEQQFRPLLLAHEALFKPIAQAILQGLGCDPHLLDQKLTGTNFGLRLNYYPPMSHEQDSSGAGRLLGHEDVDLFTILPAPRAEGLQVWNHRSGKWVRLRALRGSIIINTGDYMQRIRTTGCLTTHRVGKLPVDCCTPRSPS